MTLGEQEKFTAFAALQPFKIDEPSTHLKLWEFEPRPLESDEVEIEVTACGICGTDIHHLTNGWKRGVYPMVAGHELIGKITAIGEDCTESFQLGQRVGVSPVCRSCGKCVQCTQSHAQYCPERVNTYNAKYKDVTSYGGYANKIRVQGDWAIPIPDNISDDEGAPLFCAGITTYTPFKEHNIGPDTAVGVVGIGGLGHLALQWARAKKCKKILAISTSEKKREDAKELGATEYIIMGRDCSFDTKHVRSLDVLIVCGSGKETNWDSLATFIRPHGKLCLLDLPEERVSFNASSFIHHHISLVSNFIGSNEDLKEMLKLASENNVKPWIRKIGNTLEEVNEAVKDHITGKDIKYRLVISGIGRKDV